MGGKEWARMSMLEWREERGGRKWMEGDGVSCDVVCDEFNVLLVKIFIILIVSEDF